MSLLLPEQPVCALGQLAEYLPLDGTVVVASAAVRERVRRALPALSMVDAGALDGRLPWVLVVGGGRLIDEVKRRRRQHQLPVRIAAAASLWGSGAEASRVAVGAGLDKQVLIGADLRPELRVRWPALAASLSDEQRRWACGDVWAHALEALLSPLADEDLQRELATLLRELLAGPTSDSAWFELSARACSLQARAGVGLAHGLAHVLEPALLGAGQADLAQHGRLCASALLPVLRFNLQQSAKTSERLLRHKLDIKQLLAALSRLHNGADFAAMAAALPACWPLVLRDPCTRTNIALVRRDSLTTLCQGAQHGAVP